MTKLLLILIICQVLSLQQVVSQTKIDFHSPGNIRSFADYLFCRKDYLRACDEYKAYLNKVYDDTVEFKTALGLQMTGSHDDALIHFDHIPVTSGLHYKAKEEYIRTLFLKKDFSSLHSIVPDTDSSNENLSFLNRINNLSYLYADQSLPEKKSFISSFPQTEQSFIERFYQWKNDPPYKSPLLAGVLSAVIPGLGKVYTENYTDAFFAALLTGIFGYIAYTDFRADHNVRGWIFTGVAAFFYSGNVYGSAASAQIYNVKIKFNFEADLHSFLDVFHYLSGDYNFCE